MRYVVACIATFLMSTRLVAAQGADSVQGMWIEVRDAASNRPLVGARVRALLDTAFRGQTDSAGIVELALRRDRRVLVTSRLGFRPDTSAISAAAWAAGVWVVRLSSQAQPLAAVEVSEKNADMNSMMREFDVRRARRGGGASYIGPEVFATSHTGRIIDILRRGIQGVKFVDSAGVTLPISSRGPVMRVFTADAGNPRKRDMSGRDSHELVYCVLRIVVDGTPKEWGYDLSQLEARDIYGIEVYAGPSTMPALYQSMGRDGYCGLILIWTRPR